MRRTCRTAVSAMRVSGNDIAVRAEQVQMVGVGAGEIPANTRSQSTHNPHTRESIRRMAAWAPPHSNAQLFLPPSPSRFFFRAWGHPLPAALRDALRVLIGGVRMLPGVPALRHRGDLDHVCGADDARRRSHRRPLRPPRCPRFALHPLLAAWPDCARTAPALLCTWRSWASV